MYNLMKQIASSTQAGASANQAMADLAKQQAPPINPILSSYHAVDDQIKELLGKEKLSTLEKSKLQQLIGQQTDLYHTFNTRQGGGVTAEKGDEDQPVTKGYMRKFLRMLVDGDDAIDDSSEDDDDKGKGEDKGKEPPKKKAKPPPPVKESHPGAAKSDPSKSEPADKGKTSKKKYDRSLFSSFPDISTSPLHTRGGGSVKDPLKEPWHH